MSNDIVTLVQKQKDFFCPAVADNAVVWEKESQFAIQAFQKNDYLSKTALSNPTSAQNAIINVAAIGITLNPASKLAYLVPRDGGVCLDISYMGLLHIAQQSGSIMWGQCKLVHESDQYQNMGLDKSPEHKYNSFSDRGAVIGGYCTVKTVDGDYLTEEMSLAEIKKVESTSKSKNGPWKTFWEEMARKTIVKRASKYWPKVDRLDRAIHHLNEDAGEGMANNNERSVELIVDAEGLIMNIMKSKGKTEEQLFEWLSGSFKRIIDSFDDMTEDEKQFVARKLEAKA